jgi:outer membrane protein assembly factor BamB
MSIDFRLEWTRDVHQRVSNTTNTMAVTDFGIIVPERHSRLVRLNKENGQVVWEAHIMNPWGWLAVTDTCVAYLNQHRFLQCFNTETGKILWEHNLADTFNGYLAANDRYLILGGWRGYTKLTCLEINSGAMLWINPRQHGYAPPILSPRGIILYAANQPKSLQLLNYEQGKIEFEVDIPAKTPVTDTHVGIQLIGDTLYATTSDGEMYLLDLKQQRWALLAIHKPGISTIGPSYINDCILFLDHDKQLCCYDLKNGQMKWRQALEHNNAEFLPVTCHENIFIIGTSEGQLIAVDDMGNRIWAKKVGKRISTPLFRADGGQLIFGTTGAIVSYRLVTLTNTDT